MEKENDTDKNPYWPDTLKWKLWNEKRAAQTTAKNFRRYAAELDYLALLLNDLIDEV